MVAFNPQFLYLSGAVNNDVAAGLAGSAIVLACVDQVGRPLTLGRAALMGLLLGLALNTKFNLVFMLAVIELAFVIAARVEVVELIPEKNLVKFETTCVNQKGEVVVDGTAWIMPPKT